MCVMLKRRKSKPADRSIMSSFLQFFEQDEIFFMSYPLLFFMLSIFFVILLSYGKFSSRSTSKTKPMLPPSPLTLPIIGNFHQMGMHPHRSLRNLAQKYGPLMLLRFGSVPVLVVSSADSARQIMKTNDLTFADRPKSSSSEKVLYDRRDVAFAPYGEYWRQMKSVCVLHLLSNKRVQSYRAVREEETALMIEKIKKCSASATPINLSEVFATLTNNVVCRVALGRKYSEGADADSNKFMKLLREFVELLGTLNIGDYLPWLGWVSHVSGFNAKAEKVAKEFDAFLEGVIEDHINRFAGEDNKDFLEVLLEIQRENTIGVPLDRVSIKAIILDVFAAGTDTTYTVMDWVMTELLRHPKCMKQLQNEVRKATGNKPDISEDDLDEMHYLKAVIKETLRLHPPVALLVPRQSTKDVKIKGYDIARGTQVIINAWAIGRDPALWEKPEEFVPDRFLNNSIDFKGHHFELIPFGSGRRICPGIVFAMKVNELFLANLVHKFDWSLPDGAKDLDMSESYGITIHRKSSLIAIGHDSM